MKRTIIIISIIFMVFVGIMIIIDSSISRGSASYITSDLKKLPNNKVGLLLGTSKYTSNGQLNPYFYHRIQAAAYLYASGKIKFLILSGDNKNASYNEPRMMKKELIKLGVPDSVIYMDFAGFRTFDSVLRCRLIFDQKSFTIISQGFHLERAVYIARNFEIEAVGYQADNVGFKKGIPTRVREIFARAKVYWDIYTGYQPKFLGEKIIVK